jgi:hypothetical protein
MGWAEKTLVVVLRASAVILLVALVPVVMPTSWMATIHRGLGLGELPQEPIVGYLTRSLSALYASHGALVLFVSFDVRRFLPVVKCLAALNVAFGAGMLAIDLAVGMPPWWIACEGPSLIVLGGVILWLATETDRRVGKADG